MVWFRFKITPSRAICLLLVRMSPPISFVSFVLDDLANPVETNTIIAACVMFVAILIAWNLPILRDIIAGLKVSYSSGLRQSVS